MDRNNEDNNLSRTGNNEPAKPKVELNSPESDDDFIITEASASNSDLVGLSNKEDETGDLGLQSNSSLVEFEAGDRPEAVSLDMGEIEPIGQSAPILPPPPEEVAPTTPASTQVNNPNEVKRLSQQEVKSIREELYQESERPNQVMPQAAQPNQKPLSPDKVSAQANPPKPKTNQVAKPEAEIERPKKRRHLAHFYRNYVQLQTNRPLRENDELVLKDKTFVLRRKTLSPKLVMGVAAPILALIAFFFITSYIGGGNSGVGRVIGVAVDNSGLPFEGGATIRFPELGRAYKTDSQGFFMTDRLPTGSHQVEYLVDGNLVGSDYCTVVKNDLTTVFVSPGFPEDKTTLTASSNPKPAPPIANLPEPELANTPQPVAKETAPAPKKIAKPKPKLSKLTLAANIQGTTLSLDGKVIGAGNMTYTRLKPGKHSYQVTKDGFASTTGTIDLIANKNVNIKATLTPLTTEAKALVYSDEDYYYSAEANFHEGGYQAALDDLNQALDLNPGFAQAYQLRGDVGSKVGLTSNAFEDYLRAAEIYSVSRNHNEAASLFSKAIDLDPKAIAPVLGRGHTYLTAGQTIAAITDFESAVKLDKNHHGARFGLGVARFNHGQYKKAIKEFKKARKLDERDASTHQYLMLAYLANNETKNVKKTYAKFIKNATDQEIVQFHTDKRFTAVVRVIEIED